MQSLPFSFLAALRDALSPRHSASLPYCLGANAYLCKPAGGIQFKEVFLALLRFWGFCEIPPTDGPSCEELMAKKM